MTDSPHQRDQALLRRNFDRAASGYDQVAALQRVVGSRLLERLDPIRLSPRRIIDLGAGTGRPAAQLARCYGEAEVTELDLAFNMLAESRRRKPLARRHFLCADAERLPLIDACAEFVFSNLMLQWASRLDRALAEARRVLKPEGLILFSTLGPGSLAELRESWARVDDRVHVNAFIDMHDVGDALIRAGFADPVMETERFTLLYEDGMALMRELQQLGASNVNKGRPRALTGKRKLQGMLAEYETRRRDGRLPATFEAVYGHAWAAAPPPVPGDFIPIRPVAAP